jgi:hypothetical protein
MKMTIPKPLRCVFVSPAYSVAENAVSRDLPMLLGRKPKSLSEFLEERLFFLTPMNSNPEVRFWHFCDTQR